MKKIVSLALCALSFAVFGASLVSFDKLQDGFTVKPAFSGKLAAADVFSDQASGTVKLSRIFRAQAFTNAYDTTTEVLTNVDRAAVYVFDYVRNDGVVFTNAGVEVHSEENRTYYWESEAAPHQAAIWYNSHSGWHYTTEYDPDHFGWQLGIQNIHHLENDTALDFGAITFNRRDTLDHYNYTTNIVTVVTTNAIIPVLSGELVVTNEILNGSCSAKYYHGEPQNDTYIFPNDRLLFNGTATGGSLRIVIE